MSEDKIVAKILAAAKVAGTKTIDGKELSSFDERLTEADPDNASEQLQFHGSGTLFYNMLLYQAQKRLATLQGKRDEIMVGVRAKATENVRAATGAKVPKNDEIEVATSRLLVEEGHSYKKLVEAIDKNTERVKFLEIWLRSWVAKGFAVSDQVRRQGVEVKLDV